MSQHLALEDHLRARREDGKKLLVPYLTGGLRTSAGGWTDFLSAMCHAGADAIEVGIPFSDPVMDGPVIQKASTAALEQGATPLSVLDEFSRAESAGVPAVVMTYYNLAFHMGIERFAGGLAGAGFSGAILPDLPFIEARPWLSSAAEHRLATVMLVAPTTPQPSLVEITAASSGWVYAVGLMGVTGERDALADSATALAARTKAVTDRPVLIGVGISTPEQAAQASLVADGVIIGTAVVRRILEGQTPEQLAEFIASVRAALDAI